MTDSYSNCLSSHSSENKSAERSTFTTYNWHTGKAIIITVPSLLKMVTYVAGEVEIHSDASVILNRTGPVTMMVIEKKY